MPLIEAEVFVLRTHPLSESDLIVVFYSRELGKIRVVAKGARRVKGRFSGVLGPLCHLKISFYERENRELSFLSSCDLIESFFDLQRDYDSQVLSAYFAEVVDALLQDREPNPRVFRLLLSMLRAKSTGIGTIKVLVYFNFWMLRLAGFLPDLSRCSKCGKGLAGVGGRLVRSEQRAYCPDCKHEGGQKISTFVTLLAERIGSMPLEKVAENPELEIEVYEVLNSALEPMLLRAVDKPLKTINLLRDLRAAEAVVRTRQTFQGS